MLHLTRHLSIQANENFAASLDGKTYSSFSLARVFLDVFRREHEPSFTYSEWQFNVLLILAMMREKNGVTLPDAFRYHCNL